MSKIVFIYRVIAACLLCSLLVSFASAYYVRAYPITKRTLDRLEGGAFSGESSFFQGKRNNYNSYYQPDDTFYGGSNAWLDRLLSEQDKR